MEESAQPAQPAQPERAAPAEQAERLAPSDRLGPAARVGPGPRIASTRSGRYAAPDPSRAVERARFGPYEVLGEVARGGMGVVYRGYRADLDRTAAIKVPLRAGEREARRFQREAQALARLRHPHVVQVYEVGVEDGLPWMAMRWIEGESLQQRLERQGEVSIEQAAALVATLADAVQACHEVGILHQDLKPDNVLLEGERPVLVDFGLVERAVPDTLAASGRGRVRGTPGFGAPEQLGSGEPVGVAVDVYGLGAILYALLTGRPPIEADSLAECAVATRELAVEPPGTPLDEICLRCLEKSPRDRFESAAALAAALRADRDAPRAWWILPLILGAVVLLLGLAVFALG